MLEVRVGGQQRLRLTRDAAGGDWVATPAESAAQRADALEAEVERLRAALRARGGDA